ncbi:MAG: GrpB family protein [Planctomycetia bacterium]|nr:GrpB family protein [Planctomycetia bacterium]
MGKPLSDMTLQELWQLFPIQLTPHNDSWKSWYEEEQDFLKTVLPPHALINHIGSTAVDAIWAKPIIDLLVEARLADFPTIDQSLRNCGFLCMHTESRSADYNKGYTENGFAPRVFHLHLRTFGDNDELYFRDYLCEHPDIAHQYEMLKIALWKQFEHNRDEYTHKKGDFVRQYTNEARQRYPERYRRVS